MKILILAPRFPHPTGKADSMTVFRIISYLAERHDIYLASFYENDSDLEHRSEVETLCREVRPVRLKKWEALSCMAWHAFDRIPLQTAYYSSREMKRTVRDLLARVKPDLAYAHLIRMGEYLKRETRTKRVLALQISQTLNYRRMIEHIRLPFYRLLYGLEYRKVRRYEPSIMSHFDSCLLISEHDKQALDGHESIDNVFYSPHGVDVDYYTPRSAVDRENAVLLCGVMETPTNIDAALWFYEQVFPLVKAKCPGTRLYIAGRSPAPVIQRIGERDPDVTVTGFVADLRDYYERIKVGIDPVRIGAGLQNKLLIGMSMKQPMVCTTVANEGIGAEDGKHLILADEPTAFADAVVELLVNDERAAIIANEARRFVETQWTWEYHLEQLETHMKNLAAQSAPPLRESLATTLR